MTIKELENKITKDVAVELAEEFDRNFERKAFFNEKWPTTKINNSKGSLLNRTGNLRRSIKYSIRDGLIMFSSSLPYASIHNQGGEITVTAKMKSYFWAMYYKAMGGITTKNDGSESKSKKNVNLNAEAEKWKGLALMKIGQKIKVEKRQIIGGHPEVTKIVKGVVESNVQQFSEELMKQFKR
ncbi:phage virion morphogenesis protein [Flavobacterium sp. AC]|uniref:Phage virion morphogenesis protein n=1 Tax=Flavobacterium azizsancarii TaxID=2961580 RepID=A0ABT4W5Y0_9FLAO|nr:phage virion morphogenesis protein [Flavobacterium azizsancarii]MDA6068009.1 phage virion morphogenesis protein [Flavobacterium azizsancarii]